MSASRSPSPSGSEDDIVMESPRVKLKRELAALDSSSDEDVSGSPPKKQKQQKPTTSPTISCPSKARLADDTDEGDEEMIVARPRGRLAARMQVEASNTEKDNSPQDDDESDDQDVATHRRLKQRLQKRSTTPEHNSPDHHTPAHESPSLFASPEKNTVASDSDDELPDLSEMLSKKSKLNVLNAKKRKEREAKEAEDEQKRTEREQQLLSEMTVDSDSDNNVSDITDDEGGRQLTQKARPTRKASKRAVEEMNRETQRMDRGRQLAHNVQTKKKITKASLFARFNFKPAGTIAEEQEQQQPQQQKAIGSSRPTSPASHRSAAELKDTPPSSPPVESKDKDAAARPITAPDEPRQSLIIPDLDDDLPSVEEFMSRKRIDKGKGKAPIVQVDLDNPKPRKDESVQSGPRRVRIVNLPSQVVEANLIELDENDDMEIVASRPKVASKFDEQVARLPKRQDGAQDKVLEMFVQARSPGKERGRGRRKQKGTMSKGQLQMSLMQRVKQQAKLERERKLEMLAARGIVVETVEDRMKQEDEVEDIVARARREAEEIMARERDEAKQEKKKARKEGGDENNPFWDDSDDESYEASEEEKDEEEEEGEIELSGSEDEEEEEEGSDEEMADNPLVDVAAGESGEEQDDDDEEEEEEEEAAKAPIANDKADEEDGFIPRANIRRPKQHAKVVSDDEDEEEDTLKNITKATPRGKVSVNPLKVPNTGGSSTSKTPTSVLRSATKPFIPGLPVPIAGPAGLGLTQIFQGTMDNSQSQGFPGTASAMPMPSFGAMPIPFNDTQTQEERIADSQPPAAAEDDGGVSQPVEFGLQQTTQMHGFDSIWQGEQTQMDVDNEQGMPTPTQDGGFVNFTPLKERFLDVGPATTLDTGDEDVQVQESPLVQRKGKLRRKVEISTASIIPATMSDDEGSVIPSTGPLNPQDENPSSSNVFAKMSKAAKKKAKHATAYNKKKSKAKDMVFEQADESEDEFAGLGGASGSDTDDEEADEELKKMIDQDSSKHLTEGDERKLAAFHADVERETEQKQVDKLFKDITTGMLRKRRHGGSGGDYNLSDEDDDGEARRKAKRRQFQKMQREMMKDERVKKVAENPRNEAFLKTIEPDLGEDDDFLAEPEDDVNMEGFSTTSDSQGDGDTSSASGSHQQASGSAAGAALGGKNPRRTGGDKKPSNLASIRDSLSSLLDDDMAQASFGPSAMLSDGESGSSEDDELEIQPPSLRASSSTSSDKENNGPGANNKRKGGVIDRISLSRQSSSSSASGAGRLAFASSTPSGNGAGTGGFKVPALLRRATTNSSMLSSTSNTAAATANTNTKASSTTSSGSFGGPKLHKTAAKGSGVNYFARESERRAKIAETEKKREDKKRRIARQRQGGGAGGIGGGMFGGNEFE